MKKKTSDAGVVMTVELRKVFESVSDDDDGRERPSGVYYETAEAALEASKPGTWTGKGHDPITHEAVVLPGGAFYLATPIDVNSSREDAERRAAIAKLSPKERKLLGLKD